jgi:hypothetical protein
MFRHRTRDESQAEQSPHKGIVSTDRSECGIAGYIKFGAAAYFRFSTKIDAGTTKLRAFASAAV